MFTGEMVSRRNEIHAVIIIQKRPEYSGLINERVKRINVTGSEHLVELGLLVPELKYLLVAGFDHGSC